MNKLFSPLDRDDPAAQNGMLALLYSGWALTLLYFPSGVLLFYLGSLVYIRDLLLAVHLTAALIWLARIGDLRWVLRQSAILALVPLFLLPAAADPDYRFEALRTVKWDLFWLDWILLGHFAYQIRRWNAWLGVLIALTILELVMEAAVGAYEWQAGHYIFATPTTWNERTLFGVQAVKDLMLRGNIRIRGFQRDVFSFANLMAMSAVLGLALASVSREIWQRVLGFAWAAGFAVMLVLSGGRSALFGIFASALLSIAYIANNSLTRRWAKVYVLVWVGITVIISFAGVGQLTDQVSGMFLGKSRVGDSTSAYMRDDNWTNMMEAFEEEPIILITGGPFGSLLDSKIAPMFHWADNQFLWDTYHLGIAGALAIGLYFFRVLWIGRKSPRPEASDVLILCLLFVIGEGIVRESLTFMGCLPLFLACGYVSAATAATPADPSDYSVRSPRPRRRRTRTFQPQAQRE